MFSWFCSSNVFAFRSDHCVYVLAGDSGWYGLWCLQKKQFIRERVNINEHIVTALAYQASFTGSFLFVPIKKNCSKEAPGGQCKRPGTYHVTGVCLPSQSASEKHNQGKKAHKPLRTSWISIKWTNLALAAWSAFRALFTWSRCTTCAKDHRLLLITHKSTRSENPVTW